MDLPPIPPEKKFSVPVPMYSPEEVKRFSRVQSLDRKVSGISSSSIGGGADKHRSGGGFIPSPSSSSSTLVAGPAQTQQHLVASAPRLMFPRCANENDMGAVEVARRESQHFLRNTDLIVSQRDEIRQHSKDLVAQAKDVAEKLEKTQAALRTFYNTLGKMADTFGINYSGNREIGQELIRLTARHKDACDILTDVSTAFRLFSGTTPSRSSSPDSGSGGATSVVDRVSKQFQKECDSARKENDDLKKSMEDMGFKYGSSIQSTRKNSIGKIKKMDTNETNKYLSKASKAKTLFVNTLTQQRKFMCIFCDSICNIVDKELRLAEKFSSCEPIYNNLMKQMAHVDKLPDNALDDIKVAGNVNSSDVVFKSAVNPQNPNSSYSSANATPTSSEPQYDSISQTSSLGSSTSLSTNASTESPSGTSSSYADSGFPSSRESSHDDPDYRDPAIYFQRAAAFAGGMAPRHLPAHLSLSAKGGLNAPAPPPRRGSCCQAPLSAMSSSNSLHAGITGKGSGSERDSETFVREKKDLPELRVMCNDARPDFNGSSSRSQMDPSLIRSYSINSASSTLNSQTIIQQRLSQPVLPMNNRTPSPASPGSESVAAVYIGGGSSSTDIWVPRENVTPTIMSKSQSSSTDTLEATDSPGQNRRHDSNIGACGSLSSSTDTLDENCHSLKGSLEPNSPNGKLSPQHQVVDKSPVIGVNGSKMNYPTVRHSENMGKSNTEGDQSSYMTIKRNPRALSVSGGSDVTSFSGVAVIATSSKDDTDIDPCEEVSEFMKQLRDQRLALKAVDKTTLDFWDNKNSSPDSHSDSALTMTPTEQK